MDNETAKSLCILLEEGCNQMYLLWLEQDLSAHNQALNTEFITEEFALIGNALMNQAEIKQVI